MTYKELKKKQNKIKELRLDIADIKSSAEKITQSISGVPASSGVSDKVGNNATRIVHIENQIKDIQAEIDTELDRLPNAVIGKCIRLRIKQNYSWVKLSFIVNDQIRSNGYLSPDAIRMACHRLKW